MTARSSEQELDSILSWSYEQRVLMAESPQRKELKQLDGEEVEELDEELERLAVESDLEVDSDLDDGGGVYRRTRLERLCEQQLVEAIESSESGSHSEGAEDDESPPGGLTEEMEETETCCHGVGLDSEGDHFDSKGQCSDPDTWDEYCGYDSDG